STAECSADDPCGTWPWRSARSEPARASHCGLTSIRHARQTRAAPSRRRQPSWSDSSPRYSFVAFPTRNDRLQEDCVLILDERHQVHIVLSSDDEDALAGVPLGVRVLQDVEQVPTLDVKDDVLEPDAAVRLELRVLRAVPGDVLHRL